MKRITKNPMVGIILSFWIIAFFMQSCSKKESMPSTITTGNLGSVMKDVVYGSNINWEGENETLAMDIYFPANKEPGKKYPLAVFIHGGGFVTGDKDNSATKCEILNDSGFIAATINYRYGWDNGGGVCVGDSASLNLAGYRAMQDANAALRFLVSKADEYSVDTSWIFVGGTSAGATTALLSTYTTDPYARIRYPQAAATLGGLNTATNSLTNTYSIKGIYSIGGGIGDSTLITRDNAVATIFFQGGADEVVPVDHGTYLWCENFPKLDGSLCIYRQLVNYHVPAVAHILAGAGHGNNGESGYDNEFMMSNTACFFKSMMKKTVMQSRIYNNWESSCQ